MRTPGGERCSSQGRLRTTAIRSSGGLSIRRQSNLAHIPGTFNETKDEQFDPEYMTALFETARELAKNGYPWLDKPPELTLAEEAPGKE